MEPTESAAPDSRLRLRRMTGAWMAGLRTGRSSERPGTGGQGSAPAPHRSRPRPGCRQAHRRGAAAACPVTNPNGTSPGPRCPPRSSGWPRSSSAPASTGRSAATTPSSPSGAVGWSLAVLTGIIVGHLVALGRARWWGGTGSGAALTLAVLLLYGWVAAGMVSLAVVVLVGAARRHRWRQGVLHGAVDILGIGAGALVLAVFGRVPSVETPWNPESWSFYAAPEVVLVATAYLAVTRVLLWYLHAPRHRRTADRRPYGPGQAGPGRRRAARYRPADLRGRGRPADAAAAVRRYP